MSLSYPILSRWLSPRWLLPVVGSCLLLGSLPAAGQALRKLERRAINRTHLTFVNGDTVQRFTITAAHPRPTPGHFYYWQGPTQILRTAGAYDGKLLTGPYQLTSRNGNLLGSGTFKNGVKTGHWRTWRADGTPLTSSYWRQGRQRGRLRNYDETGQLRKPTRTPPPPAPAPTAVPVPAPAHHFWQPGYWKDRAKRPKPPRRERAKPQPAPAATPAGAPPGPVSTPRPAGS